MAKDLTSPEAFEYLVREHQAMVFRTLMRLTGRNNVEDLAQEAFLRLYRALPEFRGDAALSTYLYRIVMNVAQDEWKRRGRERARIVQEPEAAEERGEAWLENFAGDAAAGRHARSPEQLALEAETAQSVEQALLELPAIERAVLVLFHQEERSYEGIAAALQLPVNTVRTHLHRGRKRLGEKVRERLGHRVEDAKTKSAATQPSGRPNPFVKERKVNA